MALIDKGQGDTHKRCVEAQKRLSVPLLTSWPCFTEAMYLLGRLRGWAGQEPLWRFYEDNKGMEIYHLSDDETRRMSQLMLRYQNVPMDLADASLVAMAETTQLRQIFTLDQDFSIYRIRDTDPFEVVPVP